MRKSLILLSAATLAVCCLSCTSSNNKNNNSTAPKTEAKAVSVPIFSADSAMSYLRKQCDFGKRVPNTKPHDLCGAYLVSKMKELGATVTEQETNIKAFDGKMLHNDNIIASYNPNEKQRVVFFAHWDCRPFSDADPDKSNYQKPVMGANDAASGVAVLMELGRLMQQNNPGIGVDLVFLDTEDYGAPDWENIPNSDETWCLGAQYWCKNNGYTADNKPAWGILLDMVGDPNANFSIDEISAQYARGIAENIWSTANNLQYSNYFTYQQGGSIIDDHYFINQLTGIPTADIIDYQMGRGFPKTWHTQQDEVKNISANTISAVGTVITNYLYNYAASVK